MTAAGVADPAAQDGLARSLHLRGRIVHHADVADLADTVVRDPQWLSTRIAEVLDSRAVRDRRGLLTTTDVTAAWPDLDRAERDGLLAMLDTFDVSYRVADSRDGVIGVVVSWLPQSPPDYAGAWHAAARPGRLDGGPYPALHVVGVHQQSRPGAERRELAGERVRHRPGLAGRRTAAAPRRRARCPAPHRRRPAGNRAGRPRPAAGRVLRRARRRPRPHLRPLPGPGRHAHRALQHARTLHHPLRLRRPHHPAEQRPEHRVLQRARRHDRHPRAAARHPQPGYRTAEHLPRRRALRTARRALRPGRCAFRADPDR